MNEIYLSLSLMVLVTFYWLSSSLVIQLFSMALYIIFNSVVIYMMSNSSMVCYLMLFSIISGLVVVLSFVMMSEPNSESSMVDSKDIFMIVAPLVVIFSISIPLEITVGWSDLLVNQFTNFSMFSVDCYLMIFVFMAAVLLIMLFVVDMILLSQGGSMLPMK